MTLVLVLFLLQDTPVILEPKAPVPRDARHVVTRGFQDADFAGLVGLERIETLRVEPGLDTFGSNAITDKAIGEIVTLKTLRHLDLRHSPRLTAEGLARLKALPSLEVLDLGDCRMTDEGLKALSDLSGLTSLDVSGFRQGVTDAGLASVARLGRLQSLRVGMTHSDPAAVTDRGLESLSKLGDLRTLDLAGFGKITDEGIAHLSKLARLARLSLLNCSNVTDAGLRHLSSLRELSELNLWGVRISDKGLTPLTTLPLTALDLMGHGGLTDEGMPALEELSGLTRLSIIHGDRVTDAGLESLSKIPRLQFLDLRWGERVTEEGIRRLQVARPGLKIAR
jgi:F-box and leucine-rich repeat protein 14